MKSRRLGVSLRIIWYLVLFFLYAPLFVVVLYSFNDANTTTHITHFSLRWYRRLFGNAQVLDALKLSIWLGLGSSVISAVLGTMLGYGMYIHRGARRLAWLVWIVYLPVATPDILYGISELGFFTDVHARFGILRPGFLTMLIAHVSFQLPFVALVVYSRLVGLDPELFNACRDLYANGWQRARFFIVPTLSPAILAGFFLSFTLSIDDLVISFFTTGPGNTTLPIYIWSAIRKGVTPEVNAAAAILIGGVFAAATVAMVVQYMKALTRRERNALL